MSRLTDRHDVPQAILLALFYALLIVGAGGAFRVGWELMGSLLH